MTGATSNYGFSTTSLYKLRNRENIVKHLLVILTACVISSCSKNEEPVTESGLTRDEVMKMAEEKIRGNISEEELAKHGISTSVVAEGDDAKELLVKEVDSLEDDSPKQ
jgi:hypothetical protein